jgi:predicted alpha/beta-fold hydrolase
MASVFSLSGKAVPLIGPDAEINGLLRAASQLPQAHLKIPSSRPETAVTMSFFNTTHLHHAPNTIRLRTSSIPDPIPLSTFAAPLIPPFRPNPLLLNGHLQTFWTAVKLSDPFPVHYARRQFTQPKDGGTFAVDFVVVPEFSASESCNDLPERTRYMTEELGSEDNRPMLITLHGISGGSHEVYLRAVLHALLMGPGGEEWEACVVNARGCAMSTITSPQLFNARWTADVHEVVKYLRRVFPNRPLFAIGFSLGANILTNYLGEEGAACELKAAVLCSNPWQLGVCHNALMRSWLGHSVYSKVMGRNMRVLFERNFEQLSTDDRIDVAAVRRSQHLFEFDREVTLKVFGYATVGEYHRDASSIDNLLKVRVPVLVLHAKDDPIAVNEAVPYDEVKANPYVFMAVTDRGGHLSWEQLGGRWFAKPVSDPCIWMCIWLIYDFQVCNFLKEFFREVVEVLPPSNVPEAASEAVAGVKGNFDANQLKKTIQTARKEITTC